LKRLTLGDTFDQDIKNANFPQLTHLILGEDFDQDISNANFPESLTHLIIKGWFSHNLNCPSLKNVQIKKM